MSVNRYHPHVFVIPEDRANSQLANGFIGDEHVSTRKIQVLEEVGGWKEVLSRFKLDHIASMDRFPQRMMILLIDFDGRQDRLSFAKNEIPERLSDRVFILGAFTEPEDLKTKLGSYEEIGLALAKDCREETDTTWGHELLRHNAGELERLRDQVRPILFSGSS